MTWLSASRVVIIEALGENPLLLALISFSCYFLLRFIKFEVARLARCYSSVSSKRETCTFDVDMCFLEVGEVIVNCDSFIVSSASFSKTISVSSFL